MKQNFQPANRRNIPGIMLIQFLFLLLNLQSPSAQPVQPGISASDGSSTDFVQLTAVFPSGMFVRFYRNTVNNITGAVALNPTPQSQATFSDNTCLHGLQYYYFCQSYTDINGSNPGLFSPIDPGYRMLKAPANLRNSSGGAPSVLYTQNRWDSVPGLTYSKVYRSTVNNFYTSYPITGWIKEKFYRDYSIPVGTWYYYWVIGSRNPDGSLPGLVTPVSAGGYIGTSPAFNIKASRGTNVNNVTISYNGIWGHSWQIWRSPYNNPAYASPISGWISSVSFADVSAVPGTEYWYYVRSGIKNGQYFSALIPADTAGYRAVYPPINVKASLGTFGDRIRLNWTFINTNKPAYIKVFRNTVKNPATATPVSGWITGTTFDDFTVPNNYTYFYYLLGSNSPNGYLPSAFSNYAAGYKGGARMLPEAPVISVSPVPATNQVTVRYTLTEKAPVSLIIFNEKGLPVKILAQAASAAAGNYQLAVDLSNLKPGIYTLQLKSTTQQESIQFTKL